MQERNIVQRVISASRERFDETKGGRRVLARVNTEDFYSQREAADHAIELVQLFESQGSRNVRIEVVVKSEPKE